MTGSVTKTTLDNGLTVLLKEMHHSPVISFMVWYRVGSRNEIPGITGISHWLEHMMFKGTPTFPDGMLDRLVSREGGYWNAFTWLDFTAFYETMPADRINLAVQLEADRMVNTTITPDEVESERTVIISERQMYENDPRFLLNEELASAAFRVHPYHHEVIGDLADLQTMTRDDLANHYRRYYAPNNAIVVAVGDFAQEAMLAKIEQAFGRIPAGTAVPPITRQEPPQKGERRIMLAGPGDTAYLTIAYRAPRAAEEDYLPLALLNAAFAGGSSLGLFSGGGSNISSRLYKALVKTGLAAAVDGGLMPTVDPHLYLINAIVRSGRQVVEVEAAIDAEIDRLWETPVSRAELDRALKRARAEFVLAGESITGQAQLLGMTEAVVGDVHWYEEALSRMEMITPVDLARVRDRYLQKRQRTVGWYVPRTE